MYGSVKCFYRYTRTDDGSYTYEYTPVFGVSVAHSPTNILFFSEKKYDPCPYLISLTQCP